MTYLNNQEVVKMAVCVLMSHHVNAKDVLQVVLAANSN